MTTVQIKPDTKVGLDEILNGVSKLETSDLEKFLSQVAHLLAKRKAPSLSKRESELLSKINQGYPAELRSRYALLSLKVKDKSISAAEHQELVALTDRFEEMDGKRLESLLELAQLRGVSLDQVMLQLGLKTSSSAHV